MLQQELKDPGIGFVTITGAEVSADLKRARIYYSVWGDENSKRKRIRLEKSLRIHSARDRKEASVYIFYFLNPNFSTISR